MNINSFPTSVRWFARTRKLIAPFVNLLNALHSGFWMGAMRDELFQAFESYPFHAMNADDQLVDGMPELESWEQELLTTHLAPCHSMLLIAAGGGHELIPFCRAAKNIEAIDFDEQLVAATNRHLSQTELAARVTLVPRYELPPGERSYDAIWVGRKFLSSIRTRSRRIDFLKRLRTHCGSQSNLVLSFYIRTSNGLDWRINQWLANIVRILSGKKNKTPIELGDHLDVDWPLYHHHFLESDLRFELEQAGFELTFYAADWFGYAVAVPQTQSEPVRTPLLQMQQA